MRPPWEIAAGAPDDVESLQTDVMRFIAILGLCLTAIFSLVNAAREEANVATVDRPAAQYTLEPTVAKSSLASAPEPAPDLQPAPEPAPKPAPSHTPAPRPAAEPVVESPASQAPGFTLEFASAAALQALRRRGDVAVYAIAGDEYWLLAADGSVRRAEPPSSYYRMHADTLPAGLAGVTLDTARPGQVTWGVTLPAHTASGVGKLVSTGEGGALVINVDGSVTLEP